MERPIQIIKLSSDTDEGMKTLLAEYKTSLKKRENSVSDIAFSANSDPQNLYIRTVLVGKNSDELIESIENAKYIKGEANPANLGKICFLFTGQGSQYPGMAKTLYETSPVFKTNFDFCANVLKSMYNINIKEVVWPTDGTENEEINRTIYSQTAIFCVEYALLKLWESWGVKPDYVVGHSLGEFSAAVCAGVLIPEDAIMLVAERSRLIDELPGGKMLVIRGNHDQVKDAMNEFARGNKSRMLDFAALNSSQQTVVAGDSEIIMEFSKFCQKKQMMSIVLQSTHAFHSKHMDPMLNAYRNVALTTKKQTPKGIRYISGVKGDLVSTDEIDANYWLEHTREKVNFLAASKKAVQLGCRTFIEVGPQPVLSALVTLNKGPGVTTTCFPSLKRNADEWSTILTSLANLYVKGAEIDWKGVEQNSQGKNVSLP